MNDLSFGPFVLIAGIALYLWACFLTASLAGAKGLERVEYFLVALLMTPVIGLLAVIASTPDARALENRAIAAGDAKRCRACRETARAKATVCSHCGGADFEVSPTLSAPERKFKNHEEWLAWKNSGSPPSANEPPLTDETLPRPRRRPAEGYRFCPNANCGSETPIAEPTCQVCKTPIVPASTSEQHPGQGQPPPKAI
jgi:hypothetical protein